MQLLDFSGIFFLLVTCKKFAGFSLMKCLLTCEGNPLEEKHSSDGDWRDQALKRLPKLKKLDGKQTSTHTA